MRGIFHIISVTGTGRNEKYSQKNIAGLAAEENGAKNQCLQRKSKQFIGIQMVPQTQKGLDGLELRF